MLVSLFAPTPAHKDKVRAGLHPPLACLQTHTRVLESLSFGCGVHVGLCGGWKEIQSGYLLQAKYPFIIFLLNILFQIHILVSRQISI